MITDVLGKMKTQWRTMEIIYTKAMRDRDAQGRESHWMAQADRCRSEVPVNQRKTKGPEGVTV